ncbi:MAG TPA: TIGR03118 family protein [Armatimonadota bacterium]|nr:TIGR03118 family protein [Armatimonadota bacterium]
MRPLFTPGLATGRTPWAVLSGLALAAVVAATPAVPVRAARPAAPTFRQVNLVADTPGVAANTDPKLVNPWGLAFDPFRRSGLWVANNGTGSSTVYDRLGHTAGYTVTVPAAPGAETARPTGVVFNRTLAFRGDKFLFVGEDGIISGWRSGNSGVIEVNNSGGEAVYKGAAMAAANGAVYLYVANFKAGEIEVYDTDFQPAELRENFVDPDLPAGYAPFNIRSINGFLYVAYAQQDTGGEDEAGGAGRGIIDIFRTDGRFAKRLVTGSAVGGSAEALNAPWAMASAPAGWGAYSNKLLVGNFGSGQIAVFHPLNGRFLGLLNDSGGQPITIEGLWDLTRGGGGNAGDPKKVYFTAGTGDEAHGLFGSLEMNRRR